MPLTPYPQHQIPPASVTAQNAAPPPFIVAESWRAPRSGVRGAASEVTTCAAPAVMTPGPRPAPRSVESSSGATSGKHHTPPSSTIAQPTAVPYAVEPDTARSSARRGPDGPTTSVKRARSAATHTVPSTRRTRGVVS